MKDMLKGGLEWFCKEKRAQRPYACKLEGRYKKLAQIIATSFTFGRFGKILWKNIPEDVQRGSFGIKQFADLCFSDTRHSYILTPGYT